MRPRFYPLALALFSTALLAGCDQAADLLGVDQFDVSLGSDARLPVAPAATVAAGTAAAFDDRIPDVFDVSDISIPEDAVTFDPAVPGTGATCTVHLYAMLDRVPALQSTIRIDEGADPTVQSVTSRFARPYDRAAICGDLGADCPVVNGDLTADQIRDRVNASVDHHAFDLDLVAVNDGACAGLLTIERLHFELDF